MEFRTTLTTCESYMSQDEPREVLRLCGDSSCIHNGYSKRVRDQSGVILAANRLGTPPSLSRRGLGSYKA